MANFHLKSDFSYVIATALATGITSFVLGARVTGARGKFGIKYPQAYAWVHADDKTKAGKAGNAFNNIQRGHQNMIETSAFMYMLLFVNGIVWPKYAAICGTLNWVGRLVYGIGYSYGPQHRYYGVKFVFWRSRLLDPETQVVKIEHTYKPKSIRNSSSCLGSLGSSGVQASSPTC